MLVELHLKNYRCFADHILPLRDVTVIVGRNNAGKSTIVEALRLLAVVVGRYKHINFSDVPDWLDIKLTHRGVSPSLVGLDINFATIFHRYGEPPAEITAIFDSKHSVTLYIGAEGRIHAVIKDPKGRPITTKGMAQHINLPSVAILPQVTPLLLEEKILSAEYVRR